MMNEINCMTQYMKRQKYVMLEKNIHVITIFPPLFVT